MGQSDSVTQCIKQYSHAQMGVKKFQIYKENIFLLFLYGYIHW